MIMMSGDCVHTQTGVSEEAIGERDFTGFGLFEVIKEIVFWKLSYLWGQKS